VADTMASQAKAKRQKRKEEAWNLEVLREEKSSWGQQLLPEYIKKEEILMKAPQNSKYFSLFLTFFIQSNLNLHTYF
jgi:hypothetical protein